ncbi:FGGY-family carbohydrate kinase [Desulfovibrio inopinatus]|uniref:FGGY-family carbohydrate kinase n=1 Tax=Desulfovibrio inopinatus TaxID=102109 RepID=UPI000424B0AB|nr:FGGY-family carbohydrate kinase [Desulfovibrio inopinatus]
MPQRIFLSIDLGTQSARVACFDEAGHRLGMAETGYETRFPRSGWAEQHPDDWWRAICACSRQVVAQIPAGSEVVAVCVGATSSTVLPIDANGEPLDDAILWMDTRARKECAVVNETEHSILRYSGGGTSVEWMLPKTLWMKRNTPTLYESADKIVEALDWINWRLCGRLVASKCNATCKWSYADSEGGFADDLFRDIGFAEYEDKWPKTVLAMGEPIAPLTAQACLALGIEGHPMLVQGGIDAHVGMLGLGVVIPGLLAVIMGTSFVHLGLSAQPLFIPGIWGPYPNAVVPGYSLLEGGQTSAAAITRWFRDCFAKDLGDNAYTILAKEAAEIPPGADGLVALDFWQGSRTPFCDPDLTGAMWGMDLHHTRGHMYRAVLESVAHGTRQILTAFAKGGHTVTSMTVCGGATKNPLWLQIIADVCQTPIVLTQDPDAVLLGGAVAASVGLEVHADFHAAAQAMVRKRSVINPDAGAARIYDVAHERYLATHEALAPLMHAMKKG